MNKTIIMMISVIVIMLAILTAIVIYSPQKNQEETIVTEVSKEDILDECTDEYEAIETGTLKVNSQEEKVSPNCDFILKIHYIGCNHTKSQYLELPEDLVNKTEEEVKEKYSDWEIEKFSSNEIILYQEKNGECGEHFLVRDKDGKVVVYNVLSDGTEKEYEVTGITTEYLPETDRINMKNGIEVNGKQELNQLIEDYE